LFGQIDNPVRAILSRGIMKFTFLLLTFVYTCSAVANESNATKLSELEKKLSLVEYRTENLISGKEKMKIAITTLAPHLRKVGCEAYYDKDIIKKLKKDVASLGKKKNISKMSAEQIARLSTQKDIISNFTPGMDCSAFE
jgi:hypothetical protein